MGQTKSSISFLVDLGCKIFERTGKPLGVHFLCQWISVLIQRFNSVLFHETLSWRNHSSLFLILVLTPGIFTFWGYFKNNNMYQCEVSK